MNISRKIENEKKYNMWKIFIPLLLMMASGYFIYILIVEDFFISWEKYFALGCYMLIMFALLILDARILKWIFYNIHIEEGRIKIKDGFFSRAISIPLERLYYINSIKISNNLSYDSIFITDKKINHNKIRQISDLEFSDTKEHLSVSLELKERYPDKNFYYYRVFHNGYKFLYYFYMIYKNSYKCKLSDTSMELVKLYNQGK